MLLQLREFLRREKIASNQQIARAFHIDLNALEPMLEIWLRKGVLAYAQKAVQTSCANRGACAGCRTPSVIYYRYVDFSF
jgi:hypothetical protein